MSLGSAFWAELVAGLPDNTEIARIVVRLVVAAVLGGILGFQRAEAGKAAGMRTHMLVALGAAMVVLAPHLAGMSTADISRIIQGTVTGIGFIGGGVILKQSDHRYIEGVTTAAGIWLTATVGIVAGMGRLALGLAGALLALMILTVIGRLKWETPFCEGTQRSIEPLASSTSISSAILPMGRKRTILLPLALAVAILWAGLSRHLLGRLPIAGPRRRVPPRGSLGGKELRQSEETTFTILL